MSNMLRKKSSHGLCLIVNSSEHSENTAKGRNANYPASHAGQSQCHAPNYLQRDFILGDSQKKYKHAFVTS